MQVTSYWGDLDNLIGKPSMMDLKIDIFLRKKEEHMHLYHCRLDSFMKTNWIWKKKGWSWNANTTMWGRGYNAKIYTKVVSKACIFEIIINYYFHIVLFEVEVGKKKELQMLKKDQLKLKRESKT